MNFSKHKDKFSIVMNDVPFGAITEYRVSKETDTTSELEEKPKHFVLTIRRRCDQQALREVINFYGLDTVQVVITRLGYKITYIDCEIKQIIEELGENDKLIYQTLVLWCKRRSRVKV